MTTRGIQEWTVPATACYTIKVWGAAGGKGQKGSTSPGKGAIIQGTFSLKAEDKLKIVVGQMGANGSNNRAAGGGGGSFVWLASNEEEPLIVAGGGGGGGRFQSVKASDASLELSGHPGYQLSNGGKDGLGGGALHDNVYNGAGGTGWKSEGEDARRAEKGKKFIGGSSKVHGGFGGGGGGFAGAGGAGGYSGGGGGANKDDSGGGGGGSYIASNASNPSKQTASTPTHGKVIITCID